MTKLQVFQNGIFSAVRATMVDYEPWFVGADVAIALDYAQPYDAVREHVDEEDKLLVNGSDYILASDESNTPISKHKLTIINESGVYALIFGSKQERAKEFKRWVTHEVLPVLRRTGQYSTGQNRPLLKSADYFRALKLIGSARADRLPYLFETFRSMGLNLPEPSALLTANQEKPLQQLAFWKRRSNVKKSYRQFRKTEDEVALALRRAYDADISMNEVSKRCGICRSSLYKYMWAEQRLHDTEKRRSVIEEVNSLIAIAAGNNNKEV